MSIPTEPISQVKLKRASLLVTKQCNLHCRMCDYPEFYSVDRDMPLDQIKQIIDQIKNLGAEALDLSGGEPMIRPDIYEIISYAKFLGFRVMMGTNGVLIGSEAAAKLKNADITFISISLEGPEPVHDPIRGPGNFQKALNAIINLKQQGVKAGAGITLSKVNYRLIVPFSRYLLEEIGVDSIYINPYSSDMLLEENRNMRAREFQITPDLIPDLTIEMNKLSEYSRRVPSKLPAPNFLKKIPAYFSGEKLIPPGGCRIPATFCGISFDGWVRVCWKYPPIGNLREMSLIEILHSQKYREFCERALAGKCDGCLTSCFAENYQ
ncbi:MAG TPA: radical SAM protein [Bacillota bacterium]|nr:radical SAM protein [Bacillota bacterium]